MAREIVFETDANGNLQVTILGIKGPACEATAQIIQDVMGVPTTHEHTPEYAQREAQAQKQGRTA